ncbi:MAG: GNAT family N-acetyltransferase [Niabella sp.]|nr:GNAT family N-acetyltransferase [Niabella sp.]
MREAQMKDKDRIVEILTRSFEANRSVNYIIPGDRKREARLKALMAYSFDFCKRNGEVFLTDNEEGCALVVFPEKRKFTVTGVMKDIRLIFTGIGLANLAKTMRRESLIKKHHPGGPIYYLWYIGVAPAAQGKGIGTALLSELAQRGTTLNRTICLETSTKKNLPWYEKNGFSTYKIIEFGFPVYFMRYGI